MGKRRQRYITNVQELARELERAIDRSSLYAPSITEETLVYTVWDEKPLNANTALPKSS